jgi:tryptophan halogenase
MNTPQRIVIVGGTAGWMAAAVFARFLDSRLFAVSLVESDDIGTVGVGEATIPQLQLLNRALGINEHAFLGATQGTYKLGIEFAGWGDAQSRYIHAFGEVGREGLAPFHALWRRGLTLGVDAPLGQYSVNAMAAAQGRITKHANGTGSGAYAFHFDAGLYARMLRDLAEKGGVSRHEGMIAGVERAPDSGDVTALMPPTGGVSRVICSSTARALPACCWARRWACLMKAGPTGCRATGPLRFKAPTSPRPIPLPAPPPMARDGNGASPAPPHRQWPCVFQRAYG